MLCCSNDPWRFLWKGFGHTGQASLGTPEASLGSKRHRQHAKPYKHRGGVKLSTPPLCYSSNQIAGTPLFRVVVLHAGYSAQELAHDLLLVFRKQTIPTTLTEYVRHFATLGVPIYLQPLGGNGFAGDLSNGPGEAKSTAHFSTLLDQLAQDAVKERRPHVLTFTIEQELAFISQVHFAR